MGHRHICATRPRPNVCAQREKKWWRLDSSWSQNDLRATNMERCVLSLVGPSPVLSCTASSTVLLLKAASVPLLLRLALLCCSSVLTFSLAAVPFVCGRSVLFSCDLRRGRRVSDQCWRKSLTQPCRKITSLTQLLETSHRTLQAHVEKRMQKLLLFIGRSVFTKRLCEYRFGFCRDAVLPKPWRSSFISRICDCCQSGCTGRACFTPNCLRVQASS